MNPLVVSILLPLFGVGLIALLADGSRVIARSVALATSLVTLYWVVKTVLMHDQPSLNDPWLTTGVFDVRFNLGLDGLSLWMFALSGLLSVTAILVSWEAIEERGPLFYSLLLVLEAGMLGVFAARDIILFYVFFEFTLIPLFFLIGIWGSEQRRYAAVKFFLFTLAGSVLTFIGLMAIVFLNGRNHPGEPLTFDVIEITNGLAAHPLDATHQFWIFLALFAGFAIKVPLFPLHTWLPLAHVQAPTAGSVLLAGILLKIGTYGFLRFSLPMLPDAAVTCMPWVLWLSAAGIIYGALTALAQSDVKRLIAYSSVSHMGYCMLGIFAFNRPAMQGGLLQMINHGLATGGLFATFGMIYERYHTREIKELSGLAKRIPLLSVMMLLFTFSSIGLPGMNGFAGEFLILLGMFQRGYAESPPVMQFQWLTITVLALFGVVLGAWYMLWLYQRVFFGPLKEPAAHGDAAHGPDAHAIPTVAHAAHGHDAHSHDSHAAHDDHAHDAHGHAEEELPNPLGIVDLKWREFFALAPLLVFVFWIGLKPQTFLAPMQTDINAVTEVVQTAYARHVWPLPATETVAQPAADAASPDEVVVAPAVIEPKEEVARVR